MGLEGVELVMAVEEEFGIAIDDRDAEQILTVGGLWDYICERVTFAPAPFCATAASFYRLRRAFMATALASRSDFRPDAPIEPMLPRQHRRAIWKQLGQAAETQLPALELPPMLEQAQMMAIIGLPLIAAMVMAANDQVLLAVAMLFGGAVLLAQLLSVLVIPWQTQFNPAWATAGGLAQTVVGMNPGIWNVPATQSREIAWERLRVLIAETLGVSVDLVRPEARFVNDLGMD